MIFHGIEFWLGVRFIHKFVDVSRKMILSHGDPKQNLKTNCPICPNIQDFGQYFHGWPTLIRIVRPKKRKIGLETVLGVKIQQSRKEVRQAIQQIRFRFGSEGEIRGIISIQPSADFSTF